MTTPHPDGSLWVYVPDGPGDPWLNPGVVQGPPGQQGPPGNQGPEGPPGTARISHLISAATSIQSTTPTPINGWSWPVEAGRSYHAKGIMSINPVGANVGGVMIGGNAQVSLCRMAVQYVGFFQATQFLHSFVQNNFTAQDQAQVNMVNGGRLNIFLDAWLVVTVSGTAAIYGRAGVNAPTYNVTDGLCLEVISTTGARRGGVKPFGEPLEAEDPAWA